jgi:hypothetical protein
VTRLARLPLLAHLQLRLATNETPLPYFYPLLGFPNFDHLRSLVLIQVDSPSILSSIGTMISSARLLNEVTVCADSDAHLTIDTLFSGFPIGTKIINLTTLDLRGFSDLHVSPETLWKIVSPLALKSLTLEFGALDQRNDDFGYFWDAATVANLRLRSLSTNLVSPGLIRFLDSFGGLQDMRLMTCSLPVRTPELLDVFVNALAKRHFASLAVFAIYPRGKDMLSYLLGTKEIALITASCTLLTEIAFGLKEMNNVSPFRQISIPTVQVSLITTGM